jgi:hypothetical protein
MSQALTWNQFRSLHKGTPKNELSELWSKYKDGTYSFPVEDTSPAKVIEEPKSQADSAEGESSEATIEDTSEEITEIAKPEILQLCKDYEKALKRLSLWGDRFTEEQVAETYSRLSEIAKQTLPEGYSCTPTDSWKLWLGPTSECLLINTSRGMAFTVMRDWWSKYYQNTIYVDRELLNNNNLILSEIQRYARKGNYLPRSPVVGVECKLPQGVKDIQLRGGQGQDR